VLCGLSELPTFDVRGPAPPFGWSIRSSGTARSSPARWVSSEGLVYPIENGIPNFVDPALLTKIEADTKAEYERVADEIYDVAVDWQFAALYEDEDAVRESMVDMLDLAPGAIVLEVGCGPGRDSFRIARRLGRDGRLFMCCATSESAGIPTGCPSAL